MKFNPYLVAAGILYGVLGTALSFVPDEILTAMGSPRSAAATFLAQLLDAALLGFAWLNWFSRYTITRRVLGRRLQIRRSLSRLLVAF